MSETIAEPTELTSQYSAQVAGDLERNLKEQERIDGEIAALQAQLTALRHDHTVLVNIQQALGAAATPSVPDAEPASTVPAPRTKGSGKAKRANDKTGTAARKRTGTKSVATAAAASSASPTLVELVRAHLAGQSEPRSAAEIAAELGRKYPERTVKTTVVRTTLEGLVAKSQAQRSKQGHSVFYSGPDAAPIPAGEDSPQQSD
ncbi:hypothetical protein OHT76_42035 [Streptomyces sp. NBC_00287]|uniref:hypothetical protein n=1 Tax=Streptomyces sp. NBC_00287 TaxID=2975702 RepID=UPI002E28DCC5|nr:hypothetical protein [Streptomyces sp. NBC_00287]